MKKPHKDMDDPKNWFVCGRPLSPSERRFLMNLPKEEQEEKPEELRDAA